MAIKESGEYNIVGVAEMLLEETRLRSYRAAIALYQNISPRSRSPDIYLPEFHTITKDNNGAVQETGFSLHRIFIKLPGKNPDIYDGHNLVAGILDSQRRELIVIEQQARATRWRFLVCDHPDTSVRVTYLKTSGGLLVIDPITKNRVHG